MSANLDKGAARCLSVQRMLDFLSHFPSVDALYAAYIAHLRQSLAELERLTGRPLASVWSDLVGLSFEECCPL